MPFRGASVYEYEGTVYLVPQAQTVPEAGPLVTDIPPVITAQTRDPKVIGDCVAETLRHSIDGLGAMSWKDLPPSPMHAFLGTQQGRRFDRTSKACTVEKLDNALVLCPTKKDGKGNRMYGDGADNITLSLPTTPDAVGSAVLLALAKSS